MEFASEKNAACAKATSLAVLWVWLTLWALSVASELCMLVSGWLVSLCFGMLMFQRLVCFLVALSTEDGFVVVCNCDCFVSECCHAVCITELTYG